MAEYDSVAHVQWELPFPLRLPPKNFLCWEPKEGTALFASVPAVGTFSWRRASTLLAAADVFPEPGSGVATFPTHDYRITSVLGSGREVLTAELTRGPSGGFQEPRPYSVANVFLCIRDVGHSWADGTIERATAVLNNVIDLYRFFALDPLTRSIDAERDTYYTLVSRARIPIEWRESTAAETLQRIGELHFGSTIGKDRVHRIGANSYNDMNVGAPLASGPLAAFARATRVRQEPDVFQVLVFSAIRRLKRFEWALAILDAQSAFEVLVASVLSDVLKKSGLSSSDIEDQFAIRGRFDTLQKRLQELDRVAVAEATSTGEPTRRFLGSAAESAWREHLYRIRHRVVHEGLREVTFDDAKRAVSAGLKAGHAIQDLRPSFNRHWMWAGDALELHHITESPGPLSRMFER